MTQVKLHWETLKRGRFPQPGLPESSEVSSGDLGFPNQTGDHVTEPGA